MKYKGFYVFFLFVVFLVFAFNSNSSVFAASTTASYKSFEIEGLDYISDSFNLKIDFEKTITGSKYEYGNIALWSALYSQYVKESDSKYYFLLVEAKISSHASSYKGGYYRMVNKKMEINIDANSSSSDFRLIKYSPEEYGSFSVTDTMTYSLGLSKNNEVSASNEGFSATVDLGISGSISWSQSVYKDNITMISSSKANDVNLTYKFNNGLNKSVNNMAPLRGDCFQRSIFIYELSNYSKNKNSEGDINFNVSYTGTIEKVACLIWGCSGCEDLNATLINKYSTTSILAN